MCAVVAGVQHVRPDADLACVERVQPVDAPKEGRFAAAAGADQGNGLVGADRKTQSVENGSRAKPLGHVLHHNLQGFGHDPFPQRASRLRER